MSFDRFCLISYQYLRAGASNVSAKLVVDILIFANRTASTITHPQRYTHAQTNRHGYNDSEFDPNQENNTYYQESLKSAFWMLQTL